MSDKVPTFLGNAAEVVLPGVGALVGKAWGPVGSIAGGAIGGLVGGALDGVLRGESLGDIVVDAGLGAVAGGAGSLFGFGRAGLLKYTTGQRITAQASGASVGGGLSAFFGDIRPKRPVDMGCGECTEMPSVLKPVGLNAEVDDLFEQLPGFLCGIWQMLGDPPQAGKTGPAPAPPTLTVPPGMSGIGSYEGKASLLVDTAKVFAATEQDLARLIDSTGENSRQGRGAIRRAIGEINKKAADTVPDGLDINSYYLGVAQRAIQDSEQMLERAGTRNQGNAAGTDQQTDRLPDPQDPGGTSSPPPTSGDVPDLPPGGRDGSLPNTFAPSPPGTP
ncbi:hypothetical protein [Nocardia wallacei]|uniref:hypothetical protein n=1 Tax=Nocardia wallacei TaxID=480035 RepID=UPI002458630A|nr:hypothetical protein [Nocardia wallacei]